MTSTNPYLHSAAAYKIQKNIKDKVPLRIAFLDIDSTMTFPNKTEITNAVRQELETQGYIVVFVTSKTEEILITEDQRELCENFNRPLPHLGITSSGERFYVDPKKTEAMGVLDPDIIIGSTGTNILIKQQKGGYKVDNEYRSLFPASAKHWRNEILKIILSLSNGHNNYQVSANEYMENYEKGKTDIAPPDYRIEVKFTALENKQEFYDSFKKATSTTFLSVQLTDDSNPIKEKYSMFITPKNATKVYSVEYVVGRLCSALKLNPEDLHLLLAGDSYPDLAMGLYGGKETQAVFILVGKSRLASHLLDDTIQDFADESLKDIKKNLVALHSHSQGMYHFVLRESGKRIVIIGDEVYPNTQGPETIMAYLKSSSI